MNMSALPFLRYELRRHLATLALGLLSLAVLPIAHRLINDRSRYEADGWNVWGAALALYVVMPLLVLAMAASGWSRERALHTLEWLHARPLASGRLFAARMGAIVVPALAWSAIAAAIHGASAADVELVLTTFPGLPGPVTLFAAQLALALGAGLLASALAASAESAFRISVLLMTTAWLVVLTAGRAVGHSAILVAASRDDHSSFLDRANAVPLFGLAAAMLIGAWIAIGRAPESRRGRLRAPLVAGGIAALALMAFLAILYAPLLSGATMPQALWLGGERSLTFAPARGLNRDLGRETLLFTHPILHDGSRAQVLSEEFLVRPGPWMRGPWPNPRRGLAIAQRYVDDQWLLVRHDGTVTALELVPAGEATAVGWSPSGDRFAWLHRPWGRAKGSGDAPIYAAPHRVIVLERDRSLRMIPVPPSMSPVTRAAWIDNEALLLAEGRTDASRRRWSIVPIEGTSASAVHELEPRQVLAAPALTTWPLGAAELPRLAGRAVALLATGDQPGSFFLWRPAAKEQISIPSPVVPYRLVAIDPAGAAIELGPAIDGAASVGTLGNLDDGSLVWAQPDRPLSKPEWGAGVPTRIYRLTAFDGVPELLCTIPNGRLSELLGQSGSWAIWDTVALFDYELWACNVETGESRQVAEWQTWAHPLAAIGDRGIFTPHGWEPLHPTVSPR
jgi:hypothetical protein